MANIQILDEGTPKERYKINYEQKTLDGTRKRKSITLKHGTTKREALRLKRQLEEQYDRSKGIDIRGSKMLFREFADWYMKEYDFTLSPSTRSKYRQITYSEKNGIVKYLGNIPLDKLNGRDVQMYISVLMAEGLSPKTIRNHVGVIRSIYDKAMKQQFVEQGTNICANVVLPKPEARKIDAYSPEEVRVLFRLVDQEDNFLLKLQTYIGVLTGCRRSEVSAITVEDIDFENKILNIDKAKVQTDGKTVLKETKTKSSVRKIPMPATLCKVMKEAVNRYNLNKMRYGEEFEDSRFIFCNEKGKPEGVNSITSRHNRFYKRHQGEIRYINYHGFRHTYASIAIAEKMDLKSVQEILGHSNIATTMDLYAVGYDSVKAEYAMKLEDILFDTAM